MRIPTRLRAAFAAAAASAAIIGAAITGAAPAFASTSAAAHPAGHGYGASHAVFVQTDNTAGNRVVAYDRAADGTLTAAGSYATGGRGGILAGSVVDHTASQGSLAYDPATRPAVRGERGQRHRSRSSPSAATSWPCARSSARAARSRSAWPSTATLLYVLNALNGGSVQGYRVLRPVRGPAARVAPRPRPEPDRHPAVHEHPRPGRLHPGRGPAHRDHQGQRQQHRRVRRAAPAAGCRRSRP